MEAEGRGSANPRGEGRMNGGPLAGSPRLSASPVRHLWVAMGPRAGFPPCFSEKKHSCQRLSFMNPCAADCTSTPLLLGDSSRRDLLHLGDVSRLQWKRLQICLGGD